MSTSFEKLKVGAVLSELRFYKVEKIKGDQVQLRDDSGENIVVPKSYVEKLLHSADQYTEEIQLSRTELIEKFLESKGIALTVNYNKKVDEKEVLTELLNTHSTTAPKDIEKEFKKTLKKALEGLERTAVEHHSGGTNEFGRVLFIDMEKEKGTKPEWDARTITVDPRTLNWLIVRGTKYIAKK